MKVSETIVSNWLKPDDIKGGSVDWTFQSYQVIPGKNDEGKDKIDVEVTFAEFPKPLGLNLTNRRMAAQLFGDEMDAWVGKVIRIQVMQVSGPNGIVPGIRFAPGAPQAAQAAEGIDEPAPF